jgi:glutamate synthase domain-containing protein 1
MCGIVGLLVRDPALEPSLGRLVAPMVAALGASGADSTGIGIYRDPVPGRCRLSVHRDGPRTGWANVREDLESTLGQPVELAGVADAAQILVAAPLGDTLAAVRALAPALRVIGYGHALEVVKDVGEGGDVCRTYAIAERAGYLAIGHTRMATESAVTAAHSHPFVTAPDLCLVHNGSFSNHASVRRRLEAKGIEFDSDNDSEVAARFLAAHLGDGDDLDESLRQLTKELDGFFTLAITTADSLAVMRDAFACKPAVVAETEAYVAVASEYRALATLPGVSGARVFEPNPEEIYVWSR